MFIVRSFTLAAFCMQVWDMRTKAQIFCLSGHENTVCAVLTQPTVSYVALPTKLLCSSSIYREGDFFLWF